MKEMIKNPLWKYSLLFGLTFSLMTLILSDIPLTVGHLSLMSLATLIGATVVYKLDNRYSIATKLGKIFEKYPGLRERSSQSLLIVALAIGAAFANNLAFMGTEVSEEVDNFTSLTWTLGSYFIIVVLIGDFMISGFRGVPNVADSMMKLFERLIALSVVIAIVRFSGDSVIDILKTDPMMLAQVLGMLLCILFAFKFVEPGSRWTASARDIDLPYGAAGSKFAIEPLTTEIDFEHTCAHEAGHALIHALVDEAPKNLMASVNPKTDGTLGRVNSWTGTDNLKSASLLEWFMLRDLAGIAAEEVLCGVKKTGCSSDLHQWECTAIIYLQNGFGEYYYQSPQNHLEVKSNASLLEKMRSNQLAVISNFLTTNKPILMKLADKLATDKVLDREDLLPYLNQAEIGSLQKVTIC